MHELLKCLSDCKVLAPVNRSKDFAPHCKTKRAHSCGKNKIKSKLRKSHSQSVPSASLNRKKSESDD